jgi:ABC-type dipeptide/oligopeptide/nickel transport system permease subunit
MDEQIPVSLSYWQDVRKRFFGNKISIVGLVILVALVLAGIIGPFISGWKYDDLGPDILVGPGTNGHWLGTDDLGRDIFTRVTFGIRLSLTVAIVVTTISVLVGVTLGGIAGYFGGWVDRHLAGNPIRIDWLRNYHCIWLIFLGNCRRSCIYRVVLNNPFIPRFCYAG